MVRERKRLLGHNDVRTTMIYTHVMEKAAARVRRARSTRCRCRPKRFVHRGLACFRRDALRFALLAKERRKHGTPRAPYDVAVARRVIADRPAAERRPSPAGAAGETICREK